MIRVNLFEAESNAAESRSAARSSRLCAGKRRRLTTSSPTWECRLAWNRMLQVLWSVGGCIKLLRSTESLHSRWGAAHESARRIGLDAGRVAFDATTRERACESRRPIQTGEQAE